MSGTVPNVTFTFTDNAQYSYSFAVTATVGTSTLTSATSAAVNSTNPISLLLVSLNGDQSNGTAYKSTNGTTWTTTTNLRANNSIGTNAGSYGWQAAYNGNNQRFYFGSNGPGTDTNGSVSSTTDGVTWTRTLITPITGSAATIRAILYSKEKQMLVSCVGEGSPGNFIYSTNGTTWQNGTSLGTTNNIWGFAYSNTLHIFVAGQNDGALWWSDNGTSWTKTSYSCASCNGQIAVNDTGANGPVFLVGSMTANGNYYTSTDGKTWTTRTSPWNSASGIGISCAYFSPTLSMWVLAASGGSTNSIATSSDGINWTFKNNNIIISYGESLQYIPSIPLWVISSYGSGNISTSPDLITWTNRQGGQCNPLACNLSDNASYS